MKKHIQFPIIIVSFFVIATFIMADTIILRDGTVVQGTFIGGGSTFPTILHEDIIIDEQVVIAQGTHIYGRIKSSEHASVFGKSKLVVDLNAVHTPKGTIAIVTDDLGYEGTDETGETLKKTGTGEDIKIPTGTILKFTLQQPVIIHL